MNLIFHPLQQPECLKPEFLFFYDKKKNMIVDGVFSKLMFSNQYVSCAGMMLKTPFEIINPRLLQNNKPDIPPTSSKSRFYDLYENNAMVKWNTQLKPSSEINKNLVALLIHYEEEILTQYKLMNGLKHTPVFSLASQLSYEHIIIHSTVDVLPANPELYLKISGVWETSTHIGITYKFMV